MALRLSGLQKCRPPGLSERHCPPLPGLFRLPVADDDPCSALLPAGSLSLFARADAGHALVVVVEDHDAFQALDALVVVDAAVALDGADLAVVPAVLAGLAAGVDTLEPGEQVVLAEHGQAGPERAEGAAVE